MYARALVNKASFGDAIHALHEGKMVAREGWNGIGLFVFKQVPSTITTDIIERMQSLPDSVKKEFAQRGISINYSNQLALVDTENNISGWSPSTSDALANDWIIYE